MLAHVFAEVSGVHGSEDYSGPKWWEAWDQPEEEATRKRQRSGSADAEAGQRSAQQLRELHALPMQVWSAIDRGLALRKHRVDRPAAAHAACAARFTSGRCNRTARCMPGQALPGPSCPHGWLSTWVKGRAHVRISHLLDLSSASLALVQYCPADAPTCWDSANAAQTGPLLLVQCCEPRLMSTVTTCLSRTCLYLCSVLLGQEQA